MNIVSELAIADFDVGREGLKPVMVVEHWTDCVGILADEILEGRTTRKVSAHFRVAADGTVYQHVKVGDTAWGAGDWQVNLRCINIEHEGAPGVPITDACYAASIELQKQLCSMFGIDPLGTVTFNTTLQGVRTLPTLCPHGLIHPDECPGTLDIGRIASGITSGNHDTQVPDGSPVGATLASAVIVPVTAQVKTLYASKLRTRQDLLAPYVTVPAGTVLTAHETVQGSPATVNGKTDDNWVRVSYDGDDYRFISELLIERP